MPMRVILIRTTATETVRVIIITITVKVVAETGEIGTEITTGTIVPIVITTAVKRQRRLTFGKPFSRPTPGCKAIPLIGEQIAVGIVETSVRKTVVC